MNDHVRRTLERLDRPVMPDPAFTAELFARLLEEAGAPPDRSRARGRPTRRLPDGIRRALVATIALGLAAAVFAVTLPLLRSSDESKLGDFGEMPPFRGIVEFTVAAEHLEGLGNVEGLGNAGRRLTPGTHRVEVVYAGADAWRFASLDDGLPSVLPPVEGSIGAWDGERFRIYGAGQNAFYRQNVTDEFTILNPLAWTAPGDGWEEHCFDAEVLGSDVALEREAIAVRCTSPQSRLWLDAETGLVLRVDVAAATSPRSFEGPMGPGPGGGFRFVQLSYGDVSRVDAAFDPPPDAIAASEIPPPPPTTLTIGEPVPSIGALEADGLELTPPNGRPTALYVWATWCPPCSAGDPLDAFNDEASIAASELNAFAISFSDDPDSASALFENREYTVPLLHDPDGRLRSWGVEAIPTLIVIDGEGRFLGAYSGDLDGSKVRSVLRAAVAGDPLPQLGGQTAQQLA